ncbi:LCP family protein [Thermoflavimicrobium daqui]|uniref:Cell envelope-related transcriptional attenuator domain-containing protein n=1 Tax=Thermoflavimicrobium daqui TaxID=2137476 RepID=A0A364K708_9BACL|nr:LCP family protein [Thermoflavimicrobium daqui]RAL25980.1 hypothetical protein DL897_07905 [Thermoflavimicrobium daqui]
MHSDKRSRQQREHDHEDFNTYTPRRKRSQKYNKKSKKTIWRVTISFVLLILVGVGYIVTQTWGAIAKGHDDKGKSDLRDNQVSMEEPFTMLLLGTDQRGAKSTNWRPDVMMVVAINPKTKSAKVLSIPRDTYVPIANTDEKAKINAAAYYGKLKNVDMVQNVRKTIENWLNIPIDYYARINFQGFTDIVDTLGGVDVTVQREFKQQMIGGQMAHFKPGKSHLNGAQALAYVRMRKQDPLGDKGRNMRQQEVIHQLMDKMVSFESIAKFNSLVQAVGNNFTYSFKPNQFLDLKNIYSEIPRNKIKTIQLKSTADPQRNYIELVSEQELARVTKELQDQLELKPTIQKANGG